MFNKKKVYLSPVFILILVLSACTGKSDILATFQGGSITRGDLYTRVTDKGLSVKGFTSKKEYQKTELEMMAVDRIAVIEAKKAGYDKSERFQFLFNDVQSRYLGAYLLDRYIAKKSFSEPAVLISHIVLKVLNNSTQEINRVRGLAEDIIQKIGAGLSFKDAARKYSEDITKKRGGRFGYIIQGIFPDVYTDAAMALKKGGYTKIPVYLPKRKRFFIIKALDKVALTPKNIDSVMSNPKMAASYKRLIFARIRKAYLDRLAQAGDVHYNPGVILNGAPSSVCFTIGKKSYTRSMLDKRIGMIQSISGLLSHHESNDFREGATRKYFTSLLLKREALSQGIDKDREYRDKIAAMRKTFLAGDYMEYLTSRHIPVTEKEMRNEYEHNKNTRYARRVVRGGKKISVPRPYAEARSMVKRSIINTRALRNRARWISSLLKRYHFKINGKELEGK